MKTSKDVLPNVEQNSIGNFFNFAPNPRKITLIHPTRARHEQAFQTASRWINNADIVLQYILSVDENDNVDKYWNLFKEIAELSSIFSFSGVPQSSDAHSGIYPNNNHSAIEAINKAAKIASCDLIIVISDDTDCPEHWDTLLLEQLAGKVDFCAKCDDGLQPTLITMPVMDRVYYERYGYVYHPDYKHMFADQELTAIAMMTGKYIKLPLSFPHLHYSTGKTPKDEINVKNDATWRQGEKLFADHLATNFGLENPVMKYEDIKWR